VTGQRGTPLKRGKVRTANGTAIGVLGRFGALQMKLKRFLLRYFPPGIILEYHGISGDLETKTIDLLDLAPTTEVDSLVKKILSEEPLIHESTKDTLQKMIFKLMEKGSDSGSQRFTLFKILRGHELPLTSCIFSKAGSKIITGSFDRSCRVWETMTGEELLVLNGHSGLIFAMAFNNPFGDKIATGSFDRMARLWDASTGECIHTLKGHRKEITCVSFNHLSTILATGSADFNIKLWDVEVGLQIRSLEGHSGEISSLCFNGDGQKLLTASFDNTAKIWDVTRGRCLSTLSGHGSEIKAKQFQEGHRGYLTVARFDFTDTYCLTASLDGTCKLWKANRGLCLDTLRGHNVDKNGKPDKNHIHPVLDACFNSFGRRLATSSSDGTAVIYALRPNAEAEVSATVLCRLLGHEKEVSKVQFSPNGQMLLTASADKTCRLWSMTGVCLQVLEGHGDEILNCTFNYDGDCIITGSKDNTCRVWRDATLAVEDQ